MDWKKELIDLAAQREAKISAAEAALEANNKADYDAAMVEVGNLNDRITDVTALVREQTERAIEKAPTPAEARDMAAERGNDLAKGREVQLSGVEVARHLRNSTTLATGTLAEPNGVGGVLRDPIGNRPSSLIDQVYVQDLTGMSSFSEPYVITEIDAKGATVTGKAGKARDASTDPTFGVAVISPYELTVTSYVDRNIARLTPVPYYQKIFNMTMPAFSRKINEMIVNGDGQSNPTMFGIKNAKNKAGNAIFSTVNVTGVDENLLDDLFYAYGSDSMIGTGARLYLTKADLKAIGMVRNANMERVYKVIPDTGNPNTGRIEDGGNSILYCIVPGLTSLSESTAGSAAIQTMVYGDPMNYELGLFGGYTIRVDESIKGVERMLTILGDAMVGGNLIVDKGFSVATVAANG